MSKEDNNKEYYHNKGQKDRSEGKYKPPHSAFDELATWSTSKLERMKEENDSYNQGYEQTDSQIKYNKDK